MECREEDVYHSSQESSWCSSRQDGKRGNGRKLRKGEREERWRDGGVEGGLGSKGRKVEREEKTTKGHRNKGLPRPKVQFSLFVWHVHLSMRSCVTTARILIKFLGSHIAELLSAEAYHVIAS